MEIEIDREREGSFERLEALEWLETNGLGGWASSTVSGANSRRYHGMLVAATRPPVGRTVLVSKLEETLRFGDTAWELGCNRYPGTIHPRGDRLLSFFRRDLFPIFEYEVANIRLRKRVAAVAGENTTLLIYELLSAPGEITLDLRPLLTCRDFHGLGPSAPLSACVGFEDGVLSWKPTDDAPDVYIGVAGAELVEQGDWFHRFQLEKERYRGLDHEEDLWTPGLLRGSLETGGRWVVVLSTEDPRGRDLWALFKAERGRRQRLLERLPRKDDLTWRLGLAADQFVVRRGGDLRTLIAGYPWFADWGRDTMIALNGICLVTGRLDDAAKILEAFAESVDRGMLPNRFPDDGEAPEYNTVDATLWFFVAIHHYLQAEGPATRAAELVRERLLPVLRDILAWHDRGTRYGIQVDDDGLLMAGEEGVQLTWMDARVGDWVVTPRQGKAVEINALWYNALVILAGLEARLGDPGVAKRLTRRAEGVRRRFVELFWDETQGALVDVVDGDHRDGSMRPNQIFALGLPFPLLDDSRAVRVLANVREHLLTPFGLRSLAADHPDYRASYGGGPWERDGAYHQGTVWSWLLGPYVDALLRYGGETAREEALALLDQVAGHLGEACVGSVSEIFDAETPHHPRGAVAQAWSVGELLRVWVAVADEAPATS